MSTEIIFRKRRREGYVWPKMYFSSSLVFLSNRPSRYGVFYRSSIQIWFFLKRHANAERKVSWNKCEMINSRLANMYSGKVAPKGGKYKVYNQKSMILYVFNKFAWSENSKKTFFDLKKKKTKDIANHTNSNRRIIQY